MPCRRCLSVPVTPEVQTVAREWGGWHVWSAREVGGLRRVVPLYLPAGRDLGVRALAAAVGLASAPSYRWEPYGRHAWQLCTVPWTEVGGPGLALFRAFGNHDGHPVVPALADIPADLPPDIRAAAALRAAYEEVTRGT